MRWQNPWAWLGLLTLALPVLVHLFSRRQTRIEPFPTLRFIDVSRLLPTRRTQLTDVLLLLLRLLVLATAVAALAQPLFRNRASTSGVASSVIVDTTALSTDSISRTQVNRVMGDVSTSSTAQLRIDTDASADALTGAAAWLATQTGTRQLIVVSDFRDGSLDSLDLAMLPRDISVRLVPITAASTAGVVDMAVSQAATGVVWLGPNAKEPNLGLAVTGAVRTLGASALFDSVPTTAQRVIVVAPGDADSLAAWLRDAGPLGRAWMGDVMVRLRADTTLVTASLDATVSDTSIAAPFTVVARNAANAPVVAVASLGAAAADSAGASRMLVWTRTSSAALTTASVLLGASRALELRTKAMSGRATPDSARLNAWEKAPAAAPVAPISPQSTEALTGPSDARWFWLAVLALLGVETLMRRRASRSTLAIPDAMPGPVDG